MCLCGFHVSMNYLIFYPDLRPEGRGKPFPTLALQGAQSESMVRRLGAVYKRLNQVDSPRVILDTQ